METGTLFLRSFLSHCAKHESAYLRLLLLSSNPCIASATEYHIIKKNNALFRSECNASVISTEHISLKGLNVAFSSTTTKMVQLYLKDNIIG